MLSALIQRTSLAVRRAYLRFRIRNAELDAKVIQAESLAAPTRLIRLRCYIADLSNQLADLEADHGRDHC